MAHSLNNAKAEQFKKRTGSFSTHGSRRGFVDLALPIPKDQLNSAIDSYNAMKDELSLLKIQHAEGCQEVGFQGRSAGSGRGGVSLRKWYDLKRKERGIDKVWPQSRHDLVLRVMDIGKRINTLSGEISLLSRRLGISAHEVVDKSASLDLRGKHYDLTITPIKYFNAMAFREVAMRVLTKEQRETINKVLDDLYGREK